MSRRARHLAARLVWGSLSGPRLRDDDRALLALGVGGLVLFDRNVEDPAQLRELVAECRRLAPRALRIAVDQEGGHIARIGAPLTRFPAAMAIGAVRDEPLAYEVARASGRELAALGVDVVLAPVLDVAADLRSTVIGARAFGDDPALVARLGAASIRGYLDAGVLPVAKHFPGHGRTPDDSHVAYPIVGGSRADLERLDLPPFRAAVAAGVPALMTAHVVHQGVDRRLASLSPAATSIARDDLGFEGLLVTDALVMDAVADRRRLDLAAVDAVVAGADVVMALDAAWGCLAGIEAAIDDGRLPADRIDAAIRRLDAFDDLAARGGKARPTGGIAAGPPSARAGAPGAHARLVERVAKRSLTLLDGGDALPLEPDVRLVVVDVASARHSPVEGDPRDESALASAFARRFPHGRTFRIDPRTLRGWSDAVHAARRADRIVLATRDAFASADARSIVASLAGPRTLHVALRSPADLMPLAPDRDDVERLVRRSSARIATYADTPATVEALADALLVGPPAFPGRLPLAPDGTAGEAVA